MWTSLYTAQLTVPSLPLYRPTLHGPYCPTMPLVVWMVTCVPLPQHTLYTAPFPLCPCLLPSFFFPLPCVVWFVLPCLVYPTPPCRLWWTYSSLPAPLVSPSPAPSTYYLPPYHTTPAPAHPILPPCLTFLCLLPQPAPHYTAFAFCPFLAYNLPTMPYPWWMVWWWCVVCCWLDVDECGEQTLPHPSAAA